MSERFAPAVAAWNARLGTLRQVVRQDVVARQLGRALPEPPGRVLDIGCGQGTQLLRLAHLGYDVTGLDASPELLARLADDLAAASSEVRDRVRTVRGDAEEAAELFPAGDFDVVLCHGVLMYFDDPLPLLGAIRTVAAPGATVSLLVRNADALAMRPAQLGDWATAAAAFDTGRYDNRVGVAAARADRLVELTATLTALDLTVRRWFGVRVLTDLAPDDAPIPDDDTLRTLLDCEDRAGRTDPYRAVAPLLHVIARRA